MAITKVTRTLLSTGIDDQSNATAITIDSSENVGIGGSPDTPLTVSVADNTIATRFKGTNGIFRVLPFETGLGVKVTALNGNESAFETLAYQAEDHQFVTGTTERMRIDSSGKLFLNATSVTAGYTAAHLIVGGQTSPLIKLQSTYSTGSAWDIYTSSGTSLIFARNQSDKVVISSSGNVGIGTSSPSLENGSGLVVYNATAPRISLKNSTTGTTGLDGVDIAMVSSDAYFFNREAGAVILGTSGLERMRINSSGNVGIGTDSPTALLDVTVGNAKTANAGVWANLGKTNESSNYQALQCQQVGGSSASERRYEFQTIEQGVANAGSIVFQPNGGNVLVGKSSGVSGAYLQIAGDASNQSLRMENAYGTGLAQLITNTSGQTFTAILFENSGASGSISVSTTSTTYNTSSDYRLKENVNYDFTALDRVAQLKPARFNFIADSDNTVDGFLAHEVQDIVPEAITGTKDAMKDEEYEVTPAVLDDDGNVVTEAVMGTRSVPNYQGIDQSKLVPLLTKAIQELSDKVDNQQTIIDNLTTRIETLENA
jgi:hypothetical protein